MNAKKAGVMAFWVGTSLYATLGGAQNVLFDFENATVHSPLPIDLTVSGITAQFSATGAGFSIQPANTMGFTPAGFSGNCIYPNSIFASDLQIAFSKPLTNFSILYSPQELGCDDSATLRVTGYAGTGFVATATTTASAPGTWPSQQLSLASTQGFDHVVVHYDARPPTCQDWGPIFLADNMIVSLAPEPIIPPTLQITIMTNEHQLAWPASATGFWVQASMDLLSTNAWIDLTNLPVLSGDQNTVVLPIDKTNEYFRLLKP